METSCPSNSFTILDSSSMPSMAIHGHLKLSSHLSNLIIADGATTILVEGTECLPGATSVHINIF